MSHLSLDEDVDLLGDRSRRILDACAVIRREIRGLRLDLAIARDGRLTDAEMIAKLGVMNEFGR